jgi:uncharacterized protein
MVQVESIASLASLERYHFINITTFRKSGTPVVTTVWFAAVGGKIYVTTARDSGKVKRIRNNPELIIAPSTRLGWPIGFDMAARARVLTPAEQAPAQRALRAKYGWQMRLYELIERLPGHAHVYLEIVPAE